MDGGIPPSGYGSMNQGGLPPIQNSGGFPPSGNYGGVPPGANPGFSSQGGLPPSGNFGGVPPGAPPGAYPGGIPPGRHYEENSGGIPPGRHYEEDESTDCNCPCTILQVRFNQKKIEEMAAFKDDNLTTDNWRENKTFPHIIGTRNCTIGKA